MVHKSKRCKRQIADDLHATIARPRSLSREEESFGYSLACIPPLFLAARLTLRARDGLVVRSVLPTKAAAPLAEQGSATHRSKRVHRDSEQTRHIISAGVELRQLLLGKARHWSSSVTMACTLGLDEVGVVQNRDLSSEVATALASCLIAGGSSSPYL